MTTTILPTVFAEVRNLTSAALANRADCSSPDNADSAGAEFLTSVRDAVLEAVEYNMDNGSTAGEILDNLYEDSHDIADSAPSVYTHTRWQQFVDLGAYREDLDDLGGTTGDMERDAGVALYMIAERLVHELVGELRDGLDDAEDDTEYSNDEDERHPDEAEWLYDSGHRTAREQSARFRELAAARPDAELRTAQSESGIFEVYIREATN